MSVKAGMPFALDDALRNGDINRVRFELEGGVDPNKRHANYCTALHDAIVYKASLDIIKLLVEYNVDLDAQNAYGLTAVMIAGYSRNIPALKFLIEKGAALDIKDDQGRTAIDIAAQNKDSAEVIKIITDGLNPPKKQAMRVSISINQDLIRSKRPATTVRARPTV